MLTDLRDINRIVEKIGEKESKVVFGRVARKQDMRVIGISDASYHQKNPTIAGAMIMIGNMKTRGHHQCIGREELWIECACHQKVWKLEE